MHCWDKVTASLKTLKLSGEISNSAGFFWVWCMCKVQGLQRILLEQSTSVQSFMAIGPTSQNDNTELPKIREISSQPLPMWIPGWVHALRAPSADSFSVWSDCWCSWGTLEWLSCRMWREETCVSAGMNQPFTPAFVFFPLGKQVNKCLPCQPCFLSFCSLTLNFLPLPDLQSSL